MTLWSPALKASVTILVSGVNLNSFGLLLRLVLLSKSSSEPCNKWSTVNASLEMATRTSLGSRSSKVYGFRRTHSIVMLWYKKFSLFYLVIGLFRISTSYSSKKLLLFQARTGSLRKRKICVGGIEFSCFSSSFSASAVSTMATTLSGWRLLIQAERMLLRLISVRIVC